MCKRWICALFAWLLPLACAVAQENTWAFSYTGFLNADTGVFDTAKSVTGRFTGADLNGDGEIVGAELTSLVVNGREFIVGCNSSDPYDVCQFISFSYAFGGQPHFDVNTGGSDEYCAGWGTRTRSHLSIRGYYYHCETSNEWTWLWTDDTKFSMTATTASLALASPVPEPSRALMLALGLAGLGAWQIRRRVIPAKAGIHGEPG